MEYYFFTPKCYHILHGGDDSYLPGHAEIAERPAFDGTSIILMQYSQLWI